MAVWPSGLRRWLQAPVRKGVGSNPTAVMFPAVAISLYAYCCALQLSCKMPQTDKGRQRAGFGSTQGTSWFELLGLTSSSFAEAGLIQCIILQRLENYNKIYRLIHLFGYVTCRAGVNRAGAWT